MVRSNTPGNNCYLVVFVRTFGIFRKQQIMSFKIYTKTGDKGTTGLYGGARISKHHIRIESYGTVDELNAHLGLLRDQVTDTDDQQLLEMIQNRLFTVGSNLASDPSKEMATPDLTEADITLLENEIDNIDAVVPPLKNFILPGGHVTVSQTHVCRCVCRRAERLVVALSESEPDTVPPILVRYLNRLSDYLFMLGRKLSHDLGVPETAWIARSK